MQIKQTQASYKEACVCLCVLLSATGKWLNIKLVLINDRISGGAEG